MAKKFLSDIELDAGLVDVNGNTGTSGQVLSSTGTSVDWINQGDIVAGETDKALSLTLRVKNTESVALTKGQVVCAAPSATPPSGNVIEVKLADNNGVNSMPGIGILNEGLDAAGGANDEGEAIMFGRISGINTSAFSVGDEVFVSDTPGALTTTKPTGVKYIQKVGVVMRDDASNGTIEVFGAGRTNDVPTPLYIDHANQRVGIGEENPSVSLDVAGRAIIGTNNSVSTFTDLTIIGNDNDAATNTIIDSNTNVVLGDASNERYGNVAITDRTLRLGRADVITATSSNTTGILNFNDSVEANSAFSNVGGLVGYFPPPTTTNDYYFISAFSENVNGSAFATGASPTASRYNMSTSPSLNCIGQKFDANTTNGGAVYITASNNSSTASSRGIFTFDARHQNQNSTVPNGHSLFEVTSGYGQTKFLIKQVSGSTNVGIGTTNPFSKLEVVGDTSSALLTLKSNNGGANDSFMRFYDEAGGGSYSVGQDSSDGKFKIAYDVDGNSLTTGTKLVLDTSGNVGIGTTSPGQKLDIAGNMRLQNQFYDSTNSQGSDSQVLTKVSAGTEWKNVSDLPIESRYVAVAGDTMTGALYNNASGSGQFRAHNRAIFGTHYTQTDVYIHGAGGDTIYLGGGIGNIQNDVLIGNGDLNVSGKIGIGFTTTPAEKLQVSGNTSITNNLYVGYNNTLKSCTYPAQYSLAVGSSNSLGGFANGIIGVSNSIDCTSEPWLNLGGNFIAGLNNNIFGGYSHANAVFGQLNELGTSSINNANTLISGSEHEVTSSNALLFGQQCRALGAQYSLTGGYDSNNFAGFGSVAIGAGATASTGNNQYAFGTGVTTPTSASAAYGPDQFVVGKFNVYSTGGRVHRFAVGNGFSDGIRSNALNVDSFGRTGLGVTAPSYQLQLSSNSAAKPTSSSWTVVSDERVKTNIQDYTTGLTEILQINPKTFDYNGKAGFEETTGNIGIIAQDVQGIMPETINTYEAKLNEDDAEETELFNFDSHPIQFALINAVKELNAKVEALEAKIQTLEGN